MFVRISFAVLLFAVAVATASAQPTPPAATPGEALFVVSGKGYGHGVGMSQYGAHGMAAEGHSYDEILAHYYTGTELARTGTKEVRVLLVEGRPAVTVASISPFTIVDSTGATYRMPKGPLTLRAGLEIPTPEGLVRSIPPLVVRPGRKAPLSLDGRAYRGRLEVTKQETFLRVVNHVALESYLQGVVAGEMPHSWPHEALRAQAVASRSYALANLVKAKPFDLYADVRSQVYLGIAGEKSRTTEAVRSTVAEVVTYGGRVASTLYFSSSGGKTASAADVFGIPTPYLVSRPDPWDKASPYHRWGPILMGARTVQSKLAVDARILDVTGVPTPSGRLRSLTLQTVGGAETIPAALLRTALSLRSTWVSIGVLRLDRPRGPVVFGSTVKVSGVARGLLSPTLSSSLDGTTWSPVDALVPEAGGSVSLAVKPGRTTRYRIEVEGAASPALLLQVAPRLQLVQPAEPGVLSGTVRPRVAATVITIDRKTGSVWAPVADATVDQTGAFRAELAIAPGSYRARSPASAAYAAATTPVLEVVG